MSYDVELEIGPADGPSGYEVTVVRSPAGEATGSLRLDVAGYWPGGASCKQPCSRRR